MEIKNEKLVSWREVKAILSKKEKEKELNYEQKNTLDYLRKFSKLSKEDEKKLIEEFQKIGKLNERQIINFINFLPQNKDQLRLLVANERIVLSEEEMDNIIKIIKKIK